ncbi:MAG: serine hydrolase domain-containing protein [Rhizobiaceae bacterium]
MHGFVRSDVTLENWRTAPFSRWSFRNVPELLPVSMISGAAATEEPVASPGLFEGLSVRHPAEGSIAAVEHFRRSHADEYLAMRDGVVLDRWVAPHAEPDRPHIVFSISKSITGLLAGIAVGDGVLDVDAPVARHVETRKGGAYADATVRNLLDMTVSLDFEEDYLDRTGPFDRYRRAMLWNPGRPDAPEETMAEVLADLPRKAHGHGKVFYYASPNTDMMGLVLEKATGQRFSAYLRERLWKPMGARGAAWVTVDRAGAARAAGGVCLTASDLARIGQLVLDGGRAQDGTQVVPSRWIDDIRSNGDRHAWTEGNFAADFPDGRYRSFWYDVGDRRGSFCAVGIHGQWLWVDPTSRAVLVRLSSRPEPSDDRLSAIERDVLAQIARAV